MDVVKAKEMARNYDAKLLADDLRFHRCVHLIFKDGSRLDYESAFLMRVDEWIVCFTEHRGTHLMATDELFRYWETIRLNIPLEELDDGF
jgi:hypothetical protein